MSHRYSNWCAVGIMPVMDDTSSLWEKMYYEPEVGFKRMEFTNSTDPYTGYYRHQHKICVYKEDARAG